MEFNDPLAYLLTFTTYGTWLHGDERGSYLRGRGDLPTVPVPPDRLFRQHNHDRLEHTPVNLDPKARRVTRVAIEGYCAIKGWHLHAIHVRTNHVHVVVAPAENSSRMLNGIKARATRELRESGLFAPDRPVWTSRGSKRRLYTRDALADAVRYVLFEQGDALPGS